MLRPDPSVTLEQIGTPKEDLCEKILLTILEKKLDIFSLMWFKSPTEHYDLFLG